MTFGQSKSQVWDEIPKTILRPNIVFWTVHKSSVGRNAKINFEAKSLLLDKNQGPERTINMKKPKDLVKKRKCLTTLVFFYQKP